MTLNFPSCDALPVYRSEDDLVSSIGFSMEDFGEKKGEGFGQPDLFNCEIGDSYDLGRDRGDRIDCCFNWEVGDSYDLGRDRCNRIDCRFNWEVGDSYDLGRDRCNRIDCCFNCEVGNSYDLGRHRGDRMDFCCNWEVGDSCDLGRDRGDRIDSCEQIASDVLDLLPSDPFGMDLGATVTAIAGWLEDFEMGSEGFEEDMKGDYKLVTGWNFFFNRAMVLESETHNSDVSERLNSYVGFDGWVEKELGDESCDGEFVSIWDAEEFLSFGEEDEQVIDCQSEVMGQCIETCSDGDGGAPHEALIFALGYLGVRDLLSAESVCRSLRSAVQTDALLWRHIHIDQPLSERITDNALLQLSRRAQGNLQCLSLVDCSRITDDGLKRVLQCNPRLTKLSVSGCTRLSIEGIVDSLKIFNSQCIPGIRCLQIGGLYGVTHQHFEELRFLLGADKRQQPEAHKPRFYHRGYSSLTCDDEPPIDIEICPRCQNLRLVYDCPVESCQGKEPAAQPCRACTFCIARCVQCGRCINNDSEYEETFCLELLCSSCWKLLLQCQEGQDEMGACSKHTIFHQEARYHFRLYC
ncbi:F-box protein SKIP14-like [Tasmannia lanceolata]|uniref:F-box protein SKIP14-like n=1 Tax=Tasmannia lanceolata TaxID=3420 RepID=UPI0040646A7A